MGVKLGLIDAPQLADTDVVAVAPTVDCGCRSVLGLTVSREQDAPGVPAVTVAGFKPPVAASGTARRPSPRGPCHPPRHATHRDEHHGHHDDEYEDPPAHHHGEDPHVGKPAGVKNFLSPESSPSQRTSRTTHG